jgi:hypothetical protein
MLLVIKEWIQAYCIQFECCGQGNSTRQRRNHRTSAPQSEMNRFPAAEDKSVLISVGVIPSNADPLQTCRGGDGSGQNLQLRRDAFQI